MPSRAGSPNKNKSFLLNRLQDMYGDDFHPILKMAGNAVAIQEMVDDNEEAESIDYYRANQAWDQVAQYTEPKLKAIEISGNPENPLEIVAYELSSTERAARLTAILERGRQERNGHTLDGGDAEMDESTGATDTSSSE